MVPRDWSVLRNRRLAVWAAFATVLLLAACTLLNPLDDYTNGVRSDSGLPDTGADASVTTDASDDACVLHSPPTRPTSGDGTGTALTFAVSTIALQQDGGTSGYDLDQQCTCQGGGRSCTNEKATATAICDQPGGVDNAGAPLYAKLAEQALTLVNYNIDPAGPVSRGRATILFQLSEWNGTPNDTNVTLGLIYSFGTNGSQDAGSSFWGADAGTIPPKNDGTDVWTFDPDSVPGGTPRVEDRAAYVRDGVLVGRFSNLALALGVVRFTVQDVIITGKLVPFSGGSGTQIVDGLIQGRDSAEDMLTQFQLFRSPLPPGNYLCREDPTYGFLRDQICASLDIRKAPGDDNKNLACDAVAIAVHYQAVPAIRGPAFPPPARDFPCDIADAGANGKWVGRCP